MFQQNILLQCFSFIVLVLASGVLTCSFVMRESFEAGLSGEANEARIMMIIIILATLRGAF